MVLRVTATEDCAAAVAELKLKHGELVFVQSAGCCDGSTPMCFTSTEFQVGPADLKLGDIEGVPFYIAKSHYEYWKHTQIIIDAVVGSSDTFSLTTLDGRVFITRSRFFTDDEWAELVASAPEGLTV